MPVTSVLDTTLPIKYGKTQNEKGLRPQKKKFKKRIQYTTRT